MSTIRRLRFLFSIFLVKNLFGISTQIFAAQKKQVSSVSKHSFNANSKKDKNSEFRPKQEDLDLNAFGGYDHAKSAMLKFFDSIKDADSILALGGRPPKGILLQGPPGVGKTLLVRIVAQQAQIPFFHISSTNVVSAYVGQSERLVKEIFDKARESKFSIIFIDEADSLLQSRVGNINNSVVESFLIEMDGIESDKENPVFVVLASNFPERIDKAIKRPGRIDKIITLDYPDEKTKLKIFDALCFSRFKKMDPNARIFVEKEEILKKFKTGAEIENWLNNAAIEAGIAKKDVIEITDLQACLE